MEYKAYPTLSNEENTRFEFQSIGKRGIVDKLILITPLSEEVYNVALLDYDPGLRDYSDLVVTDNGDMPEVLATVMQVILRFLDIHPDKIINFRDVRSHELVCIKYL